MRKFKKLTSIFLAVLLAFSMTAVAFENVSAAIDENGCYVPSENVEDTNRYYFAMPNEWYNSNTDTAGVYWWNGTDACNAVDGSGGKVRWPGYKAQRSGINNVYYIDCPKDVPTIVWNNYINGGTDTDAPVYLDAKQAKDAGVEYYSDGNSDLYDYDWFAEMEESFNGDKAALGDFADNFFIEEEYGFGFSFNFDNMIYVVDLDKTSETFEGKKIYFGDWYFYYGNGEYGIYPTKEESVAKGLFGSVDDSKVPSTKDEPVPTEPSTVVPPETRPQETVPTNPTDPATPDEPFVPVYPDDYEGTISFDVKKSGWNLETNKKFFCHIWKYDGSNTSSGADWPQWQSKKELCIYNTETGIATYDLTKTGHNFDVSDGAVYCVIFSSVTGMQTYNAIMSGSCIGDTLYCNGVQIENPEDSERKCMVAVWENNSDCGPEKKITSTGNIVGTAFPDGESDVTLVANYLMQYYEDPTKTERTQYILDTLKVSPADVIAVVKHRAAGDDKKINAIVDILSNCTDPTRNYFSGYYYSKNFDGTVRITGYDGDVEELVIPRKIGSYQIKSISDNAFKECTTLKSVTIPVGVTDVGSYAFLNCNNLKSVTISSSVINIGQYTFGFRKSKYTNDYIKIDGFTISGVKGSIAEEYANEVGFDFVAIEEEIIGDVDDNGVISVSDATLIQKYLADLTGLTPEQIKAADVNGDGTVNVHDATAIQLLLVS